MKNINQLNSKQRKQHLRLLRRIRSGKIRYVRGEDSFRMVERLHKAGLITACVSKANWMGRGNRAFRELALFLNEQEAKHQYSTILPRK